MDIDQMVDTACEQVGSTDLGDETWREGLEVLVHSLTTEAALNELGVSALTDQIVLNLVNRLEVEQWYARHPEIDDQQIVAPLFGLGLPRTGSTALGHLLAQDPARRTLRVWEATSPCPPPEAATEHTDPRIAEAQTSVEVNNEMFAGLEGMVPTSATGPMECIFIMGLDFRSLMFEALAFIPSYSSWLMACDMEPAYRYHRRVLKLLQWRCPPERWCLKSPAHMLSINAVDAVYPDARFVMTHRDVAKVLPSVCALYDTMSSILTDRADPLAIGAHNVEVWRLALERLIDFRDRGNEDRFRDLSFEAVQRDPLTEVARLYSDLGDDLTSDTRQRMEAWWAENSKPRSGPGSYRPEAYGLDPAAIQEQFGFYYDRFDLQVEHQATA